MSYTNLGVTKTCHICNTEFLLTHEWVYKKGTGGGVKYFCRYNCLRVHQSRDGRKTRWKRAKIEKELLTDGNA